ncbi:phosphomannomutase / phosphoglucomutase [Gammaproteobacteria bacterium]
MSTDSSKKHAATEEDSCFEGPITVLITAVCLCLLGILAAGFFIFQYEEGKSERQQKYAFSQVSAALSREVASFVQGQVSLLESLAQDINIARLINGKDKIEIAARESELKYLFPGAFRVRLLRKDTLQEDMTSLAMLRGSENGKPPAEIHLYVENKYTIAIVRPVQASKEVVGHILLLLSLDSLENILDKAAKRGNTQQKSYVSLTQNTTDRQEITFYNKSETRPTFAVGQNIEGTRWRLYYAPNLTSLQEGQHLPLFFGVFVALVGLIVLVFGWLQCSFSKDVRHDVRIMALFIKELHNHQMLSQTTPRFRTVAGALEIIQQTLMGGSSKPKMRSTTPAAAKHVIPVFMSGDVSLSEEKKAPVKETKVAETKKAVESIVSPTAAIPETPMHAFISEMVATPVEPQAEVTEEEPVVEETKPINEPPVTPSSTTDLSAFENLLEMTASPLPSPIIPIVTSTSADLSSFDDLHVLSMDSAKFSPPPSPPAPAPIDFGSANVLEFTERKSTDLELPNQKVVLSEVPPARASLSTLLPSPAFSPFRAYDVRGIIGEVINTEFFELLGSAVGSEALERGCQSVVVARDNRESSSALSAALMDGMLATGCNLIDLGEAPISLMYFAVQEMETNAGVMITAGHNPSDWNGLKILLEGEILAGEALEKIRQRIENKQFFTGIGSTQSADVTLQYFNQIGEYVQLRRPLRVVVDGGNGVAGDFASRLYSTIECGVEELFCEIDSRFPNHFPDPTQSKNLQDLIKTVKTKNADLGLAFSGDGSRLGVVTDKIISPDRVMKLFVRDILSRDPGGIVLFDVQSGSDLSRYIKEQGGRPLMWKTGYPNMIQKMKAEGALLAGEMSGHFCFNEPQFGFDDALYAGARLLEILSRESRSPREVFGDIPEVTSIPELYLHLAKDNGDELMETLIQSRPRPVGADVHILDGLRAEFEDGWGVARSSNTIPALVFRFEARTPQALQRIQKEFRRIFSAIDQELKLPF